MNISIIIKIILKYIIYVILFIFKENNSIKEIINNEEKSNVDDSNNLTEGEEENNEIDEENDESDDDINEEESFDNENEEEEDTHNLRLKKYSYNEYINSKIETCNYFDKLKEGDYIYGIKQDKYYKIFEKNDKFLKMKMIKNLGKDENKIMEKNENNTNTNNKLKNEITISYKDYSNYRFHQKIKIKYINYLNMFLELEMSININGSIKDMLEIFTKVYHIPNRSVLYATPSLVIIINNIKYSQFNDIKNKYFVPNKFDYKNDYVIIIEKEYFNFKEVDLGSYSNYLNLKKEKVPHFVCSLYYNFEIGAFLVSKYCDNVECEIYEINKDKYINIDFNDEKRTKNRIKEFLDLNLKEKTKLISVIKSNDIKKVIGNFNAIGFKINQKLHLMQGKMYIFWLSSPNKKIYTFNPRSLSKEGLIIVSKNDKSILIGFEAKKISDFEIGSCK